MSERHPERLARRHRLRAARDFDALKESGVAFRGRLCVLVVLSRPAEETRVGFVASKRTVGGSPQRNRARRRLREIVRRRMPRLRHTGYVLMLIASKHTLGAPHQELASEVERLLAEAGALRPLPALVPE
jgi:ribonuclease P protein component